MKFLDLFSGIGGFHEGMTRAGHECVGFCEYDKYAVASYTSMYLITDEQREYLATLPLKQRQQEILKEEYRNGMWYRQDIRTIEPGDVPRADIWCFGAPCQDFSIAGQRAGLEGDRSSLVGQVFRLVEQIAEEMRPKWLVYENVKGMLSSNGGKDYLAILAEMDRLGYDAEWCNINSKWYVPQNRERIYTVGHLRAYGTKKIFPLQGADGEDSVSGIEQVGKLKSHRSNPNSYRVYEVGGIAPTLSKMDGGGREPHIVEEVAPRERERERIESGSLRNRLQQRWSGESDSQCSDDEGLRNSEPQADRNCCGDRGIELIGNTHPSGRGMNGNVFSSEGIAPTLTTNKSEGNKVALFDDVASTHTHTHTQRGCLTKRFSEQNEISPTQSQQERTEESPSIIRKEQQLRLSVIGKMDEHMAGRIYDSEGLAPTLNARDWKSPRLVAINDDE